MLSRFWNGWLAPLYGSKRRWRWGRWWLLLLLGGLLAIALPFQVLSQTPEALTNQGIMATERRLEGEYEDYFGRDLATMAQTPTEMAQTLARIQQETGTTPAILWVTPRTDHLHLSLLTPHSTPVAHDLYDVSKALLVETVRNFHRDITQVNQGDRLENAQQLYQWIIAPLEADYLQPQGVDTLLVCLSDGVRGLSLAALHDGQRYLIEKYALTRIPAFNLMRSEFTNIQQGQLLAMGASQFQGLTPLPAVPVELANIVDQMETVPSSTSTWEGETFLNEQFTLNHLRTLLTEHPFDIVHLATHAEFNPGDPTQSYIQFWDTRLTLDDMRHMDWHTSQLELLVLSACRTALGNSEAELGFAGLALQANVKSALASLWYVSDAGTLALMSEFYRQLTLAPTRAEALRQAQLRLLRGEVRFEGDQLVISRGSIPLPKPPGFPTENDLSHPLYWAGFTLVSSPW